MQLLFDQKKKSQNARKKLFKKYMKSPTQYAACNILYMVFVFRLFFYIRLYIGNKRP